MNKIPFHHLLLLSASMKPYISPFPGNKVSWSHLNSLPRPAQKSGIGIADYIANLTRNIPNAELSGPAARVWGNVHPGIL